MKGFVLELGDVYEDSSDLADALCLCWAHRVSHNI